MTKSILAFSAFFLSAITASATPIRLEEARQIATEAYVYLYPLISMDVTRRQATNMEPGKLPGFGPSNMFNHMREFPAADYRSVVRPNFDTLYSSAWLDLSQEPMLVTMPDTAGRYYLLPMLDLYTDVLASHGSRTSGTGKQIIAVLPPNWKGQLPNDVSIVQATTPYLWIIGRIQTNGAADYPAVHKIQDGMIITPLSQWGKTPKLPPLQIDPNIDMKTPPLEQVNAMASDKYFAYGSQLMKENAPHFTDWSQIERFKRIGLNADGSFDPSKLPAEIQKALAEGAAAGLKLMKDKIPTLAPVVNGWSMNTTTMGVYGNYYLKRAIVALVGLGANQPEDAIYPLALADKNGQPLTGDRAYVLHFSASELPPNSAFWSLTMYDEAGFQVANELNRFSLGSAHPMKYNADGSLDIFVQATNPGAERVSNWLPAPAQGILGLTMRIYAPKPEVLDGRWVPPAFVLQ